MLIEQFTQGHTGSSLPSCNTTNVSDFMIDSLFKMLRDIGTTIQTKGLRDLPHSLDEALTWNRYMLYASRFDFFVH